MIKKKSKDQIYCFCSYSPQSKPNLQHSERKKKSLKKCSDQSTKNSPSNQVSPSSSFSKITPKPSLPTTNPPKQFKPNQDYFPIIPTQFPKKITQPSVNTTPKKLSPSINFKYTTPVKKSSEKVVRRIGGPVRTVNTNVREKKNSNKIVVKRAVSYEDSECESQLISSFKGGKLQKLV